MIISTLDELRLYSPSNAIDHFDTMAGFIDSSEHDFLADKLGESLYEQLKEYYRRLLSDTGIDQFITDVSQGNELTPYARLLTICQRMVVYDALQRAIDIQAISVNGSGVNVATADEYAKADRDAVNAYKKTCYQEAHSALNRLLILLEKWSKTQETVNKGNEANKPKYDIPYSNLQNDTEEKSEIIAAWRNSRYYYLSTSLLIPTCDILQEYVNIYDSREKFISLLPDLRYIQDDVLAPIIGEELMDQIIPLAIEGTDDKVLQRVIKKLRKAEARHLESRTMRLKIDDARRITAKDEAIKLTSDVGEYLMKHYKELPESMQEAFRESSFYEAPVVNEQGEETNFESGWQNNQEGSAIFVTPFV